MVKERVLIILLIFSCRNLTAQWDIIQTIPGCYAVDFVNDSTGLLVHNMIDGSYILKTVDYGVTWDTVAAYTPAYFFYDVVFASDSVAFACGGPDLFLKSLNGGNTWFDPTVGQDPFFTDLFFISDLLGYGANGGGNSRLGVTIDGGLTWGLNEMFGGKDLHFYGECDGGTVIGTGFFNTSDCANVWDYDTIETINRTWKTIWMQNSDILFIGATGGFGTHYGFNYGSIGRSFDGGDTFYILDIPYTSTISDLVFTDELTGYAGCSPFDGYQYSILKTIDGGETWGYQEIDMNPLFDDYSGIHEIDCPSPGFCYAVGGGIYRTTNGGGEIYEAWVEVGTSEAVHEKVSLNVYPNPALSSISIANQKWKTGEELQLHIYDVLGKLVFSRKVRYANPLEIDVSSLPSGTYAIHAECDGEHGVKWFVKE